MLKFWNFLQEVRREIRQPYMYPEIFHTRFQFLSEIKNKNFFTDF